PVEREEWAIAELVAICDGLAAMARHHPGFIHRRPDSDHIFVDREGTAKLRAPIAFVNVGPEPGYVGRGHQLTSFHWMSPEQVMGRPLTPASDVFALGSTLHALLSLQVPFRRGGDFETLVALRDGPSPAPATSSAALARVLARAHARVVEERYP